MTTKFGLVASLASLVEIIIKSYNAVLNVQHQLSCHLGSNQVLNLSEHQMSHHQNDSI